MPSRVRSAVRAAAAACLPAALAGCLSSSTDATTNPVNTASYLRIVQGVSDATNGVDFSVNGAVQISSGLSFGTFYPTQTGLYGQIDPGVTLAFTVTGAGAPFFSRSGATSPLSVGGYYTLIAYGRAASGAAPAATGVLLTDTTFSSATPNNPVLLRVFNAVDYVTAGLGTAVDVYVYTQGTTRPTTPTMQAVAYGTRSAYVTSTAATLTVDVFAAGAASTGTPLFTAPLTTGTSSVRTLVLLDPVPGATAGNVLVLPDQN